VKFSSFNGAAKPDGSKYVNLSDGYEIYSTGTTLGHSWCFPGTNALVYLSSENLKNDGGFGPGGSFEPGLEGHSWFVSRLMSHALLHSGVWPSGAPLLDGSVVRHPPAIGQR
jgi:hypothetical protein